MRLGGLRVSSCRARWTLRACSCVTGVEMMRERQRENRLGIGSMVKWGRGQVSVHGAMTRIIRPDGSPECQNVARLGILKQP